MAVVVADGARGRGRGDAPAHRDGERHSKRLIGFHRRVTVDVRGDRLTAELVMAL